MMRLNFASLWALDGALCLTPARICQVTTFIEAEDKNFSLFNYVNELNNEVEKLEEQIAHTRREIEKHRGQVRTSSFSGVCFSGRNHTQRERMSQRIGENLEFSELDCNCTHGRIPLN